MHETAHNRSEPDHCLSVIIPAYNEQATIGEVLRSVLAVPSLKEIIVVDDCSVDDTFQIARSIADHEPRITLLRNDQNLGKTDCVKVGIAASSGSIVIVQDADLEYSPNEIERLTGPIAAGAADVVYGSRFSSGSKPRLPYYSNYLANRSITFLSNLLSGLRLHDVQTCYFAIRGDIARSMIVTAKKFGFEVEAAAKLAKLNITIEQVPITYNARTYEEGKKVRWTDGFAAVWYIVKYNLLVGVDGSFRNRPDVTAVESRVNPDH